ncbi:general odorant-binding protein 56h-like [Frankliniella occidentalis]|uniref:General odorant-binding protein 56h-like n=1 Tax=Frankliniella occidentalis TaxID=133901 RepID=A0A6J1S1I8_FRAOC|nr:general odorant-binding protein 56h-like [Frankliniella occidentalis]
MKVLVLSAAVLLVAQQVCSAPPPFVHRCMQENGVTGADAIKFAETGEASDGMKCNFKCIMMEAGVMTPEGKLILSPMLEHVPEKIHQAFKDCVEIEPSSDLCDVAFRHNVCLREKATDFYKAMVAKKHQA